jgi:Mg2+-importing ATPase
MTRPESRTRTSAEQLAKPRRWHLGEIRRFILFFGPLSSVFDDATFFVLLWIFGCRDPARASTFQTGWFVESLLTQTLIIHVIRTNRIPFCQSRASSLLTLTTALIIALGIWLPFSPLGPSLGFVRLPASFWSILLLILLSYAVLSQLIKSRISRIE